jgi:hypothetical protein
MITCSKCNKEFAYNYLLLKHQNRKKRCTDKQDDINDMSSNLSNNDDNIHNNIVNNDPTDNNIDNDIDNIYSDNSDSENSNYNENKIKKLNKNDIEIKKLEKEEKYIEKQLNKYDKNIKKISNNLTKYMKESIKNNRCNKCNKDFTKKYNVTRHVNDYCVYIKEINQEKNKLTEEKNKLTEQKNKLNEDKNNLRTQIELQELRKAVTKLLKRKSHNINITNNKITNNNLMVNINSFGNESLSHITINDYKKFLSGLFPGFIRFIEKVHFDENAPENHNICITNMNSRYLFTYDKGNWLSKDKNETIDKFIAKKYNILVDKFDELEEKNELDEKILERFNIFSKNYQDIDAQRNTKNDIMLMIYNNKNKVNMK